MGDHFRVGYSAEGIGAAADEVPREDALLAGVEMITEATTDEVSDGAFSVFVFLD